MRGDKRGQKESKYQAMSGGQEGQYERIKLIGQGTFGKVYLVRHDLKQKVVNKEDNKHYALKEVLQDKRYKNRQLSIIKEIHQVNLIQMIDFFIKVVNQQCFLNLVMDYIPSSLNILIKEQRKFKQPFSPELRKIITFQLFKALYYMQTKQLCHRDLKPPNILINDKTFQLKICDFGSAKFLEKGETNVSYICSRYYRAPQLILSSTTYSTEIDVWSAGCIMVELLTLQPIFPGDSSTEQLIEIIKILGTPPHKYIQINEEAIGSSMNLPKIQCNPWSKILKKYHPEPELIDLITGILTFETDLRLKPLEVLKHEYFKDLTTYADHIENLPYLFNFKDLFNGKNQKAIIQLDHLYECKPKLKDKHLKFKEEVPSSTTPGTFQ